MEDTSALLLTHVLFGAVGLAFFTYGKKQKAVIPFVSGVGLFIIPYYIDDMFYLILTGLALVILPFFIKIKV